MSEQDKLRKMVRIREESPDREPISSFIDQCALLVADLLDLKDPEKDDFRHDLLYDAVRRFLWIRDNRKTHSDLTDPLIEKTLDHLKPYVETYIKRIGREKAVLWTKIVQFEKPDPDVWDGLYAFRFLFDLKDLNKGNLSKEEWINRICACKILSKLLETCQIRSTKIKEKGNAKMWSENLLLDLKDQLDDKVSVEISGDLHTFKLSSQEKDNMRSLNELLTSRLRSMDIITRLYLALEDEDPSQVSLAHALTEAKKLDTKDLPPIFSELKEDLIEKLSRKLPSDIKDRAKELKSALDMRRDFDFKAAHSFVDEEISHIKDHLKDQDEEASKIAINRMTALVSFKTYLEFFEKVVELKKKYKDPENFEMQDLNSDLQGLMAIKKRLKALDKGIEYNEENFYFKLHLTEQIEAYHSMKDLDTKVDECWDFFSRFLSILIGIGEDQDNTNISGFKDTLLNLKNYHKHPVINLQPWIEHIAKEDDDSIDSLGSDFADELDNL